MLDVLDGIVLPFLESLYAQFGYVGVAIAMTIESAAIPIPSELILPFAGWSVARGVTEPLTGAAWSYWGAVVAGVVGNTAGSLASYAVGAFGGYHAYIADPDGYLWEIATNPGFSVDDDGNTHIGSFDAEEA